MPPTCARPAPKRLSVTWRRPRPRMSQGWWPGLTRWYSPLAPARAAAPPRAQAIGAAPGHVAAAARPHAEPLPAGAR